MVWQYEVVWLIWVADSVDQPLVCRRRQGQLKDVIVVRESSLWSFECGSFVLEVCVHGDDESVVCGH